MSDKTVKVETVKELTVTSAITDSEYALLFRFIADCIESMTVGDALVISLHRYPILPAVRLEAGP